MLDFADAVPCIGRLRLPSDARGDEAEWAVSLTSFLAAPLRFSVAN